MSLTSLAQWRVQSLTRSRLARLFAAAAGKDCASLEFSSTVPFFEWLQTVGALCGPATSPVSLSYDPSLQASTAVHRLTGASSSLRTM